MKKKVILTLCLISMSLFCFSQDDCIFETQYRNPIDTSKFVSLGRPSIVLFVHSKCGHSCPTQRMQKTLEIDSCAIRKELGIKLYVVYPSYSTEDIQDFYSYKPKNAEVLFWVNRPRDFYGYKDTTPYILLFNGKGQSWSQAGGTYEEFINLVKANIHDVVCPYCGGSCHMPWSNRADYWLDPNYGKPCSFCHGTGRVHKYKK